MSNELARIDQVSPPTRPGQELPALVVKAGGAAAQAWTDFFDGRIRNDHTRRAYGRSVRHFLAWCEAEALELRRIMAGDVGRYLRQLSGGAAKKKGTLAALRRYFRVLVERHICLVNPAAEAEAERYETVEGKTPEITDCEPTTHRSVQKDRFPLPHRRDEWPWVPPAIASFGVGQSFSHL